MYPQPRVVIDLFAATQSSLPLCDDLDGFVAKLTPVAASYRFLSQLNKKRSLPCYSLGEAAAADKGAGSGHRRRSFHGVAFGHGKE